MQLDGIDPEPHRASGGRHEGVADAGKTCFIQRQWRRFVVLVRDGRWRDRLPAALGGRDQLTAFPWPRARGLTTGMGELDRNGRIGMFAYGGENGPERRFRRVVPEAEATCGDTADRLHACRLDAEHRGPRQR
jgi:hypothetical protein